MFCPFVGAPVLECCPLKGPVLLQLLNPFLCLFRVAYQQAFHLLDNLASLLALFDAMEPEKDNLNNKLEINKHFALDSRLALQFGRMKSHQCPHFAQLLALLLGLKQI